MDSMDSKQKRKAPVPIQADADHEVVTTPLFKLYQTNSVGKPSCLHSICAISSGCPQVDFATTDLKDQLCEFPVLACY